MSKNIQRNTIYNPSAAYSLALTSDIDIIELVEAYFGIPNLTERTRKVKYLFPRQLAIWLLATKNIQETKTKNKLGMPQWSKIAKEHFNGFDHATIMHSYNVIENYISTDPEKRQIINDVQSKLVFASRTIKDVTHT